MRLETDRRILLGMQFIPMPEDEIKALLEDAEDIQLPRVKSGPRTCRSCGGAIQPLTTEHGSIVLKCMVCGLSMDPETGLITQLGNPVAGKDVVFSMVQPLPDPLDRQPTDRKRHKP